MTDPAASPLVLDTGTPPIPEAKAWLSSYDGAFGPPIDLSQAAPGGAPHGELLRRLGEAAADAAVARYGPIAGDEDLRAAFAEEHERIYGASLATSEIAITAGCNLAFVVAAMACAAPGSAVLLPAPWYFNHEMTLKMLGVEARPLPCRAENGFVPDPEVAARLIDDKVRAIVLVTPNNPTGAVYPPQILEAFARLCAERGLWLIVDETYRDFLPAGQERPHDLFGDAGWRARLVQLYSFSKSYAVPGHRLGAIVAGRPLMREIGKVLDSLQICAPRVGQRALVWGIPALRDWREESRAEINARAAAFTRVMGQIEGWRVDSVGAYFAYVRHPFGGATGARVAERLARERGVLALPGSYFGPGQETHLRVAFANVGVGMVESLRARLSGFAA